MGGGVIIRDAAGHFIAGLSSKYKMVREPLLSELLAAREGVLLARKMGLLYVILELDCAEAVLKLNKTELDRSVYGGLFQEIKMLCSLFMECKVVWCCRNANVCAHVLAKAGCTRMSDEVYGRAIPLMY